MNTPTQQPLATDLDVEARQARDRAEGMATLALRMVCANLPWLSGLAHVVTLHVDERVRVAAVTATGRVLVNPEVFSTIPLREAVYIIAHELLHLALDSFSRETERDDHETVNRAHDYIINDMLRQELGMSPPLNGLDLFGASEKSLEQMVAWMNQNPDKVPVACWTWIAGSGDLPSGGGSSGGSLTGALRAAGILPEPSKRPVQPEVARTWHLDNLDVIPRELERELFPHDASSSDEISARLDDRRTDDIRRAATKSLSLGELDRQLRDVSKIGGGRGHARIELTALRDSYVPPWELALQHWLEASVPGDRSYARPSRRGADRSDCVLPGRTRVGWTIHIVLDTSGSMLGVLPRLLGMIADFSEGVGVSELHLIQCGDELTADDWVRIEDVASVELIGGGGGGLTPGFERLASDPEVQSALIITDTYEEFPATEPPFNVLWAVVGNRDFQPPYGTAMFIDFS